MGAPPSQSPDTLPPDTSGSTPAGGLQPSVLLRYRPWRGDFGPTAWSVWPVARVALGMMFRRKMFWVLYGLGLLVFCLFFFGQYLLAFAQAQLAEETLPIGVAKLR